MILPAEAAANLKTSARKVGVTLSEDVLIELLTDPRLAAEVLLGWEVDDYQGAALKLDWWFPETIDDSGVSSGKTLRIFLLACLRAILIPGTSSAPGHWVGVYFQNFQVAKDEFWPYFEQTVAKSDFFASQVKLDHGKLGEHKLPGAWRYEFKIGSRIIVPAPGHSTDGSNHATRRFNTLIVDEWRMCEEKGDAIAKQLIGRVTRDSFNQHHPIWGNHIHFKGHAESPNHKSHWRVQKFRDMIRDGSTRHAMYSFCYRDVSDKKAKDGRPWKKILINAQTMKTLRAQSTPDERLRQLLGIIARSGISYYPEAVIENCRASWVVPIVRRASADWNYFLGFDVARGASIKADYSSAYVLGARKCPENWLRQGADGIYRPTFTDDKFGAWQIAAFYAYAFKNKSAPETAAYIHWLHERFGFSGIALDPGGGGLWIYPELRKAEHMIDGVPRRFIGLCSSDEPASGDKQPIVKFIKRGGGYDRLSFMHKNNLVSDDGFLFGLHQRFQGAWIAREIALPTGLPYRSAETTRLWEPDQIEAQKTIDIGAVQLSKVRQLTNDSGGPLYSRKGFPLIGAQGKKDVAYSKFYAWIEVMRFIESHGATAADERAARFSCSY